MDYFRTYKDEDNIYFLFEYIDGVTLADVLNNFGTLFSRLTKKYKFEKISRDI